MTRRLLAVVAAALAMLMLSGVARAAAPTLTDVDAAFPDREFILTLGSATKLKPSDVTVTENGDAVDALQILPTSGAGQTRFGTVLVIDTSNSMHDQAIKSAIGAARAFAATRSAQQPLGVVYFNGLTRVGLPLTTDAAQIQRTLAVTPPLARGTHIYDGVALASDMLAEAKINAGSIIVLSDGSDTGSAATEAQVVATAQAARTKIFAVGIQTRAYSRATLAALAVAAKGQFTEAKSEQSVARLYRRLGAELSNQYVVRYRSLETLGANVQVTADVRGFGKIGTSYFAPALPPSTAGGVAQEETFFQSSAALGLIAGLVALAVGFMVLVLLAPRASVRQRVGQFVSPSENPVTWSGTLLERAFAGQGGRGFGQRGKRTAFADELVMAGVKMPAATVIGWTIAATLVVGWLFVTASGPVGVVFALAVPVGIRLYVRVRMDRQRKAFDEQLPDNLQVIASAMRAGHTFLGAVGVVVQDAPEPSRRELRRILADERLGTSLADAMSAAALRMGSRDFEQVALVAGLQSESGGNSAEVIDRVTESIRERLNLRRLVSTLTAQGRLAGVIVAALPIVLLVAISAINPGYLSPMFHTTGGVVLLIVAGGMLAAGAFVIKRIVDIDV